MARNKIEHHQAGAKVTDRHCWNRLMAIPALSIIESSLERSAQRNSLQSTLCETEHVGFASRRECLLWTCRSSWWAIWWTKKHIPGVPKGWFWKGRGGLECPWLARLWGLKATPFGPSHISGSRITCSPFAILAFSVSLALKCLECFLFLFSSRRSVFVHSSLAASHSAERPERDRRARRRHRQTGPAAVSQTERGLIDG